MMPLTMAKAGETVTVRKISGKDEVRQHLAELGEWIHKKSVSCAWVSTF